MLPARSFFMIRHGETVMNARRLTCGGGVDTILNEQGRRQAFHANRILNALSPEARPTLIVHSGMKRTLETTSILNAGLDLPVLSDSEMREHMMGEWEEKAWEDVLPRLYAGEKPKGGEDRAEFAARVKDAMIRHLTDHASERILFVAHGGTFHSFALMHGVARDVFIPNAALHRFDPEPAHGDMPWRVHLYEWPEPDHGDMRIGPAPFCPSQPGDGMRFKRTQP